MRFHEGYDWGHGFIVSGKEGVIEPIVQSIQKCFLQIPDEIEKLYHYAFETNNFNLLYRMYMGLRELIHLRNSPLAARAGEFVERFEEYFHEFLTNSITEKIEDEKEREELKRVLNRVIPKTKNE
jgi:hypothetical protein